MRPLPDSFAALLGAYAGALGVTIAVVAGASLVVGLSLGAVVFVGIAGWATGRDNLAVTMARRQYHVGLLAVSAAALVGWMVAFETMPSSRPGLLQWLPFLALAGALGLGTYLLANQRVLADARARDAVLAEWTAEPTATHKWLLRAAAITAAVVLLSVGMHRVTGPLLTELAPTAAGVLFAFALLAGRERKFVALSEGLYVTDSGRLAGQFVPWSRFSGYTVTDTQVALYRRLPLFALRSARTDIRDVDTITSALDDRLVRREPT